VPSNHGRSTCPRPGVGAQILVPLNFSAAVVPLLDPAGGLSFQDSLLPTPVKKMLRAPMQVTAPAALVCRLCLIKLTADLEFPER